LFFFYRLAEFLRNKIRSRRITCSTIFLLIPHFREANRTRSARPCFITSSGLGFKDPAPNNEERTGPGTQIFNIHTPIRPINSGVGFNLINDRLGFEKTLSFQFSYAYHIKIKGSKLGIGAGFGIVQKELDGEKYLPIQPGDPLIPIEAVSDIKPDLSAGIYYSNPSFKKLYAGLSFTHLMKSKLEYTSGPVSNPGTSIYELLPTMYLTSGATFALGNPILELEPSILIKSDFKKAQYDLNVGLWYDQTIRGAVAVSYNKGTSLTAMVGYKISKDLFASYSWDIITNQIKGISPSTHEFLVTYCFNLKTKPPVTPRPLLTPRFL
jgi:type IX secretion system PorP/SprF family membrane protein